MLSLSRMRQNWLPTALLLKGYNRHNAHISQKATATRVLQGHYGKMRDFLKETIFNQTKHSSFKAGGLLGTPAFQSVWHLMRYSMQYASWSNKQFWVHLQAFQARRQFHPIGYTLSRQDFLSLFCYCNVPEIEMTNCIDSTCLLTKLLTTSCIPLFPFSVPILKWDHWGNCKKGQCECSAGIVHVKHVNQLLSIAHETQF